MNRESHNQSDKVWSAGGVRGRHRRFYFVWPLVILVVLSAGIFFFGSYLGPLHEIREVRIQMSGNGQLAVEEIEAVLGIEAGLSFTDLDWAEAALRINSMPRVKTQRLSYQWPHVLKVSVVEYVPVAVLLGADGQIVEVTRQGVVFPPRGESLPDLPILSFEFALSLVDLAPGERIDLPGTRDLLGLFEKLQRDYGALWCGISEARLLNSGGYELFWNDSPIVIWGQGEVSETQIAAWLSVINDLQSNGETDAVVDLRFRDQVLVRLPADQISGQG